jgi:excisionase family DNA binding protein
MTERLLLRPDEAFKAIGVSRSKGYELLASGVLPSVTVGGCRRVPVDELKALIRSQVEAGRPNHGEAA